jgi:predicted enzyme related to lactoylglutathione lyase
MTLAWEQTVVDAADPRALGEWWVRALGWVITFQDDDEIEIRRSPDVEPGLLFVRAADAKVVKNRLHIDLRPDDQDAEVARLVALGARPIDIGQGGASWVVLADPEGNEFCVLSSRRTP